MLTPPELSRFLDDVISFYHAEKEGDTPKFLDLRLDWEDKLQKGSPEEVYLQKLEERFLPSPEESFSPNVYQPITELELTIRSYKCLKSLGIEYVGELIQHKEKELTEQPNFGKRSLREIKEVLMNKGLSLGMTLVGWISPSRREKMEVRRRKEPSAPLTLKELTELLAEIKQFYAERSALEQVKNTLEYAQKKEDFGSRFYDFSTNWQLNPRLGFPESIYLEKIRNLYLAP